MYIQLFIHITTHSPTHDKSDQQAQTLVSYPGLEGQENLWQKEDKALQADGEVLQDKVCDPHGPDQIKEVKAVQVGLGKYEAR